MRSRSAIIRLISALSVVVYLFDYWYSGYYVPQMGEEIQKLLRLNGFGGFFEPIPWMFHVYYVAVISVLVLMTISWRLARPLLIAFVCTSFLLSTLFGASVAIPSQVILGIVEAYLIGALLLLNIVPEDTFKPDRNC